MLSLDQLLTPINLATAQQRMITLLQGLGFKSAAAWQEGTLPRTLGIEVPAALLSDGSKAAVLIAAGGYNDTAEDSWLDLYSKSAYDNTRHDAVRAYGKAVLTADSSAEAMTLDVDYVVASDDSTTITFRNKTGGSLAPGGSLTLEFEAETAGSVGNLPLAALSQLKTSLAGVSISNPGTDGEWLTRYGADRESNDQLRERNRAKWATRAYASPGDAYVYWAREADPAVKRVSVDGDNQLDGPGSVRIYIAGDTGPLAGSVCDAVIAYIRGLTDGLVRRPIGAAPFCVSATTVPVHVSGTVYYATGYDGPAVQAQVQAALDQVFRSLPIGGSRGGASSSGAVLFSQLYAAAMKIAGVVNMAFTAPLADVPLTGDAVAVPIFTLSAAPV